VVKARVGKEAKLLLVFDGAVSTWIENGVVSEKGIGPLIKAIMAAGIPLSAVSAVCLADVTTKPKASDYKEKSEYVTELIDTYGYNVVVPIGAAAFDKISGYKGIAKYFGKVLYSDTIGRKIVPCPNPAQAKYEPSITGIIASTLELIKTEMEFPEVVEAEKMPTNYTILDTLEKFNKFYDYFLSSDVKAFAYDLETTGFQHNKDEILTIQFSHKPGYSYLIPTDYYALWSPEEWTTIKCSLRRLFADESKVIVGHNKKFDDKFMYHHWGVAVRKKRTFDTLIASFLCNENTPNGLKDLACTMTDMGDYELPLERFKDAYCKEHKLKKKEFSYKFIPFEILAPYALADTDVTIRLYHQFLELLVQEEQEEVFQMVMRFSYLLTKMEINGWPVDVPWAVKYREILTEGIEKVEAELLTVDYVKSAIEILSRKKLAADNAKRKNKLTELKTPFEFNIGSSVQKKVLFFDVMGLPVVKFTKTKNAAGKRVTPSTDKEVMDKWIEKFPEQEDFLMAIKTVGMLTKIRSTYVDAVINKSVNGRIHPTYNACGAKTGRLSSKDPNLQNIMARVSKSMAKLLGFDPAKYVKKMFRAPDGSVIIGSDLSAAEMRYACVASGDKKLTEIFLAGVDVHCAIAKELFPYIPVDMPDAEIKETYGAERNIAKTVQFLSLYGGGASTLAAKANILVARAEEILDDYFRKYAGVDNFIKETTRFTEQTGYSLSLLGRKRRVPAVNSEDDYEKAKAIRQAVNSTIQSVASDGLLISACCLLDDIEENDLPIIMLGPIHDALYVQAADSYKQTAREKVAFYLEQFPVPSEIPMLSDCEWGEAWCDFSSDWTADSLSAMIEEDDDEDDDDEIEYKEAA
jgi:DNA polymerase I-like protein with 3'-5' exonuclease and polymerase domains